MKVADLMRTNVLTVPPGTPLKKVNEILHHFQSDYVLITEGKKFLGLVTYSDLFRLLLPSYQEFMENESYWLNPSSMESRVNFIKNKPVEEIMQKNVISVGPSKPIINAGALMVAHKIKQMPVIENGELVGVLSFRDITWGFLMKPKDLDE